MLVLNIFWIFGKKQSSKEIASYQKKVGHFGELENRLLDVLMNIKKLWVQT